jgi:putative protease
MNNHLDPEKLKIPAYLRKKAIVRQSRQKLILTALDRKQAGLGVHSQKALAPVKVKEKTYSNVGKQPRIKKSKATFFPAQPNFFGSQPATSAAKRKSSASFLRDLLPVDDEPVQRPHHNPTRHEVPTGCVEIVPVGHITAYIEKIQVAIIKLAKPLRQGDLIQITADDLLFQQPVDSMQINRKPVKIAKKGSEIGLKVSMEPRINGPVYKVLL